MAAILQQAQVQAAFIAVCGVLFGLLVNGLAAMTQRRHVQKTVVTAIRSDIRSIVQALEMTGVVASFIRTLGSPEHSPEFPPWSDSPREENYFKLYEALAPQIGVVRDDAKDVVRFYTFMRISRDAAAPFSRLRQESVPSGDHHTHAANVLVALLEALGSAAAVLSKDPNDAGQSEAAQMVKEIERALKDHYMKFPARAGN